MKEYKTIKIGRTTKDTEHILNKLSKEGWKVVCSYAIGSEWLILERTKSK